MLPALYSLKISKTYISMGGIYMGDILLMYFPHSSYESFYIFLSVYENISNNVTFVA